MIGVIDCRSHAPEAGWAGTSPEMLEFFDRPLLQHAVEQMVQGGVTHCVILAEDTSAVMQRWGTGERWGCTFSAIPPRALTSFLVRLLASGEPRVMVGRGDCIPCLPRLSGSSPARTQLIFRESTKTDSSASGSSVSGSSASGSSVHGRTRIFTGWAISSPQTLLERFFPTQGAGGLLSLGGAEAIQVELCIRSHSPGVFLHSQELVLDAMQTSVIVYGVEIQPGVWAARRATLHPSVTVSGKVFLGENVRIGRDVSLVGPLVIGRDSVIDAGSQVMDASIQPTTYVGRGMKLEHDIVLPGSIIRAQEGVSVTIDDPRLLASTEASLWSYLRSLLRVTRQPSA